jgi:hypothetical protein
MKDIIEVDQLDYLNFKLLGSQHEPWPRGTGLPLT